MPSDPARTGLPALVLKSAKEALRQLNEDQIDDKGQPKLARAKPPPSARHRAPLFAIKSTIRVPKLRVRR